MRVFVLILAASVPAMLNWSCPANAAPIQAAAPAELRLPHISIQSVGTGRPVILIPGLSTPRAVWSGIATDLARTHRVILVQVNGFAGDPAGENLKPGVLKGIVDDLHTYAVREKLDHPQIIGHSMGGLIAMMAASEHPQDFGSVMVVDALPFAGVMFEEHATVDAVRPLAAMLKTKLAAGYAGPEGAAAAAATAKGLTAKADSAAAVEKWVLAANPQVAAEAMAEDLTTDLRPLLPSIKAHIVLVHPVTAFGKDPAQSDSFYRTQFEGAPDASFVAIPDSGHFIMLDQPEAFAEAVDAFVK